MLQRLCSNLTGFWRPQVSRPTIEFIRTSSEESRLTFRCTYVRGSGDMCWICRNNVRKLRHLRLFCRTTSHDCNVTTISVSVAHISCFNKFFFLLDHTYTAFHLGSATKISVSEKNNTLLYWTFYKEKPG
jgi:hypothetical protein